MVKMLAGFFPKELSNHLLYTLCWVLSNGFLNYDKVGIELDKAFNAHKDKTKDAHDITKNHRREEQESTITDSW